MRHGTCFRRHLAAHRAGAAPHSAVAELGVVRRFLAALPENHVEMQYWSSIAFLACFLGYFYVAGRLVDYCESSNTRLSRIITACIAEFGFWTFGLGAAVAAVFGVRTLFTTAHFLSPSAWVRTGFFVFMAGAWCALFYYRLRHRWRWPTRRNAGRIGPNRK